MLGELAPATGERVMARGTRIGYLPQEAAEAFEGTVLDRAMEAHRHMLELREELDALHQRLHGIAPDDPHLDALLERAGELQHRLELDDEHALEPRARAVLSGLGFATADQDRPLATFSGGWRMRAALAALLLTDPTLLFLDEPTNHLDLPAMEWLEEHLETFHGGLVVVSHDRVFLDRVTTEIRELDHGRLDTYATSFTRYLEEKELRREQMEARNEQLEARIAQLSRFVERFGAKNTKATQAQSKRKQIERLKTERVVLPRKPRGIRFQFPDPPHSGRTLVRLRDASFGYDGGPDVFARAQIELGREDKVAIVGANGAGKTTLLRVIAGQLATRTGTREDTPLTRLAYFAQHAAETLEPSHTVLGALEEMASAEWRPRLRSLLGHFLFSGDDAFKLTRVLSGGERQRVALARLLLHPGEPAAARRAHAPPRPRRQGGAGGSARAVPRRRGGGDPRPLADGAGGDPGARGARRTGDALPRRVRRLGERAPRARRARAGRGGRGESRPGPGAAQGRPPGRTPGLARRGAPRARRAAEARARGEADREGPRGARGEDARARDPVGRSRDVRRWRARQGAGDRVRAPARRGGVALAAPRRAVRRPPGAPRATL